MNALTMTPGSAFCLCLAAAFFAYPKEMASVFTAVSLKIQIHWINARMFVMAWFMHRRLSKDFAEMGLPTPPFKFVPLWERGERF